MNDQTTSFRVGIFVLASLILLGVLITLFGGFPGFFRPMSNYTILFDNAQGVTSGTPVRRSGVKIGEVRDISLENKTGQVRVLIEVDDKYTLRKGDLPTIVPGLLGGDVAISFLPPEEEKKLDTSPVASGTILVGHNQADATTLLQKTSEIMPPAQEAMVELRKVFKKIDKMLPVIEDTMKEFREFGKTTREMVPELKKTNDEIRALAMSARDSIPKFTKITDDVARVLKSADEAIPKFTKAADEFSELAKSTRDFLPDLRKTSDEFQLTARSWGKVGERVDILLQTNEKKLVRALDELDTTLKNVNEILGPENQKYIRNTLKNVEKGSGRIEKIADGTEKLVEDVRVTLKDFTKTLDKVDGVLGNIEKATKPVADRGEAILKNVDESAAKLNQTLGDFRDMFKTIARSDGTLQRLLSDPALYKNLNETASGVQQILPRLDRILRDVEIFADKIARHPEALGVGGALRPSNGLKEPPTSYRIFPTHHP